MISNKAKAMSSPLHIQHSRFTGAAGERRFYDSCKANGLDIKKATKKDDMYKHIDFLVGGKTFDAKGMKGSHGLGQVILEMKNVQGKRGWCNDEELPSWVAFDFGLFFINVKNADLFKLVHHLCDLKDTAKTATTCLYKGYSRKDRNDLMTAVTIQDIFRECENWILPYSELKQEMELL